MDGFTWLRHKEHGGYWRVPETVVAEMADLGWEPSDPPEEVNPAVVERIAWEREQAEQAERNEEPKKATKATKSTASEKE